MADISGLEYPFPETPLPQPIESTEQGKLDNPKLAAKLGSVLHVLLALSFVLVSFMSTLHKL